MKAGPPIDNPPPPGTKAAAADTPATTAPLLDWPTPPYFIVSPGTPPLASETCVIHMLSGDKRLGEMVQFSLDGKKLLFRPARSVLIEAIALETIKTVRLVRALVLVPREPGLQSRAQAVSPPSERQTYSIRFVDNQIMEGETLGYSHLAVGLYLFMPSEDGNDDGKVVRCFIPEQSMIACQIGRPIGELLVDEKLATRGAVEAALRKQHQLRAQRLGDYLAEHRLVTREQLELALRHQESKPILRLGEALEQLGLITNAQLDAALDKQRSNRKLLLGQILVDMKVIDERTLQGVLAKKLGIPYVQLSGFNFDPDAIRLVPGQTARKHIVMPLCVHDDALVVAFENPMNAAAMEELRFTTQRKIVPAMASQRDIVAAVHAFYDAPDADERLEGMDTATAALTGGGGLPLAPQEARIGELASQLFDDKQDEDPAQELEAQPDSVLVRLINKMIVDAYQAGVSDIHVEPFPRRQNTIVRFRRDGTLTNYLEVPAKFRAAMISRIKIMAQLDISEKRRPQDGKIDFSQHGAARLELRVATIPTSNGLEDVVLRLLSSAKPRPLDALKIAPDVLSSLLAMALRPYGFIVVCGPTGSGKTTTLHSLIGTINTPERKIWTAEDPIEITQPGLRQVQVNARIGWTFAAAMRAFLRADPDVIMIGEMRDEETAKVAIEASLTGHLVLSTLHTNSAAESVIRLLDLGMDPFNFSDALIGVLAQRLAKALCPTCKTAYEPTALEIDKLAAEYCIDTPADPAAVLDQWRVGHATGGRFLLQRATGCEDCHDTGYHGRIGVHELLTVTAPIKRLIQARAPLSDLLPAAFAGGMRTLKQDGIEKVLQGHTDILQVRAVCA